VTDAGGVAVIAVERLRLTLDGVAAALGGARLEELLSTEEQLVAALAALSEVARANEGIVSPELRAEITLARSALDTCRQLGAVVRQVCDACVVAQGRGGEYNRAGSSTMLVTRGAGVQARV
jgi:uncharacterized protein YigA (DUF484 family)